MYLHAGSGFVVNEKDIIGIFDMDNTTVSHLGRNFLSAAQKNGEVINASEELPKSYIVADDGRRRKVYISSISSKVLSKRTKTSKIIL